MRVEIGAVLIAAELARVNGSVFLCTELMKLAEHEHEAVDHEATELSRRAVAAIEERLPLGVAVSYAIGKAADAELRHLMLTGEGNR